MRIGFGEVEITPPLGTELGGYGYYLNRRAHAILDPLMCRAVAIHNGGAKYAIVNCDLVQLSDEVIDAANLQLAGMGYLREHTMMLAVHTHTAPVAGILEGCGRQDEAYIATLPDAIVKAVERAEQNMADVARVRYADAEVKGVASNRAEADGPLDERVRGALFERKGERSVALLSYACHPVTLGRADACSADYAGQVVARLREHDVDGAMLNGFCGDVNPASERVQSGSAAVDTIRSMGRRIADGFCDALREGEASGLVRACRLPMKLRNQVLNEERIAREVCRVAARAGEDAPESRVVRAWAEKMRAALAGGIDLSEEPFEVCMLQIGALMLIGLPYECYTLMGMRIREALPGRIVLAMGCCGHTLGYLPTAEEFARDAYAASASAYLYLRPLIQPGEAERIADALAVTLAEW